MSDMTPPPAAPVPPAPSGGSSSNAKLIATLGWIFAPWGIIAIFLDDYKNDMFVRSHTIQAAAFAVVVWIASSVLAFIGIGLFIPLIAFIIQIIFAVKAWGGSDVQVPVVYGVVKNFIEQTN